MFCKPSIRLSVSLRLLLTLCAGSQFWLALLAIVAGKPQKLRSRTLLPMAPVSSKTRTHIRQGTPHLAGMCSGLRPSAMKGSGLMLPACREE